MMSSRFGSALSPGEFRSLLDSALNGNTRRASSTWLRVVTAFREEKKISIYFGHCDSKELDEFLCEFYTCMKPQKEGQEYS